MKRRDNRKRRWKQSYGASAFIFIMLGVFAIAGVDGKAGNGLSAFFFFMAALDIWDYNKGWKIKGDRPAHANRFDAIEKRYQEEMKKVNK